MSEEKKLIVAYIVEGDEELFELSYNSIKDVADDIFVVDGNHNYKSQIEENKKKYPFIEKGKGIIFNPYPHEDKGANGKQRNKYLEYLKKEHLGEWCLVLDADEVVDKPEMIKEAIKRLELGEWECADIHMRHLIQDFGKEDAMVEKHFVPTRLFKITKDIKYAEAEHVTIQNAKNCIQIDPFCIWHFGYARELFTLRKKYLNHLEKSNMHTPEFLEQWYHHHIFGIFPTSKVKFEDIPEIIKKHFKINDDYMYFKDRHPEQKHAEMVRQWHQFFKLNREYHSILDLGCGRGPYLRYWEMCGYHCNGIELSDWACKNKVCDSQIIQGDIVNDDLKEKTSYTSWDLVTAIDVLEHLEEKDLPKALKNIYETGKKYFLFSIPFVGDPNLYNDHTHKIFQHKSWWIDKLKEAGFKILETPEYFGYKEQIIIAGKENE